jgi:hypothetical protein
VFLLSLFCDSYASPYEYSQDNIRKAELRVKMIKERYKALGYGVLVFDISDPTNIDMIVENRFEVIGIEITNWNEKGHLSPKKFNGYKRHYKKVQDEMDEKGRDKKPLRKLLIVSYLSNVKDMLKHIEKEHIEVEIIGHQDIPKPDCEEEPEEIPVCWTE